MTIPSDDLAFARVVDALARREPLLDAAAFQRRLARLFPRVTVRPRELSGEPETWYCYRDGRWRGPQTAQWWLGERVPELHVDREGWIISANAAARTLLGLGTDDAHHYADVVAPGAGADADTLFRIVRDGRAIDATVLLRPIDGRLIACELHAQADGDGAVAWLRLADDVDLPSIPAVPPPALRCDPPTDPLFAGYARRALEWMPDRDPEALARRLRRLYPHAMVDGTREPWVAIRDGDDPSRSTSGGQASWWLDESVPSVRYDADGLILAANPAAARLLGGRLVGAHWQDLVTPGSQDQVAPVLALIAEVGEAVSRFRMPGPDGGLVEFDSWTRAQGPVFETRMRAIPTPARSGASPVRDG